ncbi:hypothetical protein BC938DRAFT_476796 [Jimgerdemannia flammicorona]|uniref:Uncharacterized protein n=1 Tax=Jimgerdemannia flammicorona TaxID=994334 RepID=A0A433R0S5_9FUNG|nr:hypothetical protein BC938DRAFT_476796 [Jimgerdemannia flammicorona]
MATHLIAIIILFFMLSKLVDSLYGSTKGVCPGICPGEEEAFVDVSNDNNLRSVPWGSHGPEWLVAVSGLNLEGKCTNKSCKAYLQDVIVQWGFKNFTLDDRQYTTCPLCKHHVRVFKCAFARWNYRAVGNMDNDFEIPTFVEGKWRWADDRYHVFEHVVGNDNTESVVGKWDFLTIVVSEKDPR